MSTESSDYAAATRRCLPAAALASAVVVAFTGVPPAVSTAKAQVQAAIEEIVVTARKREESLQDIPLAIAAFTSQDIQDAGLQELGDIALQTAGMEFSPRYGGSRAGRIDSVIRLRGVSQSSLDHLQPTSLFIDGIFVLGTANSIGLQDLERVEVIKGPQSAFFGRNTFAGAINFITKSPDLEEYNTQVDVSLATYDKYDGNVLTSGPIISGKLAYQLNARLYHRGAEWVATDGGELGRERSNYVSGVLYGEPTDNLSFKFRAYYQKDDDGPPVAGLIRGRFADTCTGTSVQRYNEDGTAIETFFPTQYICGKVPEFGFNEPGGRLLSRETTLHPSTFFQDRSGFISAPVFMPFSGPVPNFIIDNMLGDAGDRFLMKNVPDLDNYGMVRNQVRLALNSDYEFTGGILDGYTASFLGGWNDTRMNFLRDYDQHDTSQWYGLDPKFAQDWSLEGRLTSPQDARFRWLLGATYYDQEFITSGSGGLVVTANFQSLAVGPVLTTTPPTNGNTAKVWGVYGAVSYDIMDNLTFDIETRYLQDERSVSQAGFSFTDKYKQLTPRFILSYRPSDNTNVYIQASRGNLPGTTNGLVAVCSPEEFFEPYPDPFTNEPSTASECAQIASQLPEGQAAGSTPSQKLDAIEVGWKQTLFDGRFRFNLTGWHYEWKNLPFGLSVVWVRDAEDPTQRDRRPNPFANSLGVSVPGSQKLWGAEFESGFVITDNWDAQFNVSWSDNKFDQLDSRSKNQLTGFTNLKGLEISRYPRWQGNLSTTYRAALTTSWDWYGRADFIYHGKYWAEDENLAQADSYLLTHARIGIQREDLRVELFVRNLFQTRDWAVASSRIDFTQPTFNFRGFHGIVVVPQEKRTFGIRTNLRF